MDGFSEEDRKMYRSQLLIVKGNAPKVWEVLLRSQVCPYQFNLYCKCGTRRNCEECWNQALALEEMDPQVKIALNGKLYCATCQNFLSFHKEASGIEVFECPTCHTLFDVKRNVDKEIISVKVRKENNHPDEGATQEEQPNQTTRPTENDEDYNED